MVRSGAMYERERTLSSKIYSLFFVQELFEISETVSEDQTSDLLKGAAEFPDKYQDVKYIIHFYVIRLLSST